MSLRSLFLVTILLGSVAVPLTGEPRCSGSSSVGALAGTRVATSGQGVRA
jgi:hypothetical protein